MDGLPARAARGMMNKIGIGMIGAGFIGQMHSLTFGSVGVARREPSLSGRLIALADTDLDLAREVQERYGWERISTDWRQAIDDPGISDLHKLQPQRRARRADRCRGGGEQAPLLGEATGADRGRGFHDLASRACCGRPAHVCLYPSLHPRPAAGATNDC